MPQFGDGRHERPSIALAARKVSAAAASSDEPTTAAARCPCRASVGAEDSLSAEESLSRGGAGGGVGGVSGVAEE